MRFLTEYIPTKFSECCILALLYDFGEMLSAKLKIHYLIKNGNLISEKLFIKNSSYCNELC